MAIKNKLPSLSQTYPVYAVIVILTYGWTIYWALWELPSWLNYLPLGEIGAVFCYLLATNLVESLIALAGTVLVSLVLPQKWYRDVFVSRGSVLAATVLICIAVFAYHFESPADYFSKFPVYLPWILLLAALLAFLSGWIHILRRGVEIFAENAVIFLFLSVPLSLLSVAVVIVRNLL